VAASQRFIEEYIRATRAITNAVLQVNGYLRNDERLQGPPFQF